MKNHSKIEIEKVILQLNNFPKSNLVAVCVELAKLVLPYWENYFDKQEEGLDIFRKPSVRNAIEISEKWLQTKDGLILKQTEIISTQVLEDMNTVSFFWEEASGNADEVKNRNKALSCIECAYQTIQCLLWTEAKIDKEFAQFDESERQTRKNNGAVFETSQAIQSARLVLENDELVLRKIKMLLGII